METKDEANDKAKAVDVSSTLPLVLQASTQSSSQQLLYTVQHV